MQKQAMSVCCWAVAGGKLPRRIGSKWVEGPGAPSSVGWTSFWSFTAPQRQLWIQSARWALTERLVVERGRRTVEVFRQQRGNRGRGQGVEEWEQWVLSSWKSEMPEPQTFSLSTGLLACPSPAHQPIHIGNVHQGQDLGPRTSGGAGKGGWAPMCPCGQSYLSELNSPKESELCKALSPQELLVGGAVTREGAAVLS